MKIIRVCAALIISDGKVLAAERGYGEWKGYWEFTGDKQEERETGEEAAIREIGEELGTDISIDSRLCTITPQYKSWIAIFLMWKGPKEHMAIR